MADFDRRRFLKTSCAALAALPAATCIARPLAVRSPYASTIPDQSSGTIVNDVHSKLNRNTCRQHHQAGRVSRSFRRQSPEPRPRSKAAPIAGGRHAMGGQQFGRGGAALSIRDR